MALQEEMGQQGRWLFRRRGHLPLLLLIVVALGLAHFRMPLSHAWDQAWEILCLAIALSGLALRAAVVGSVPKGTSGRSTTTIAASSLNTRGIYSIVRNPLYLGNALMWLGVSLLLRQWWASLIFLLVFWLYYERIIFAEEEFLRKEFGDEFLRWAAKTPAFLPRFCNWEPSGRPFSVRRVLRREYSPLFSVISAFTAMELLCDWAATGRPRFDSLWLAIFLGGGAVCLVLRTLKKKTRLLDAAPADTTQ